MPKPKRSPIPHIITDAELAQFRGLTLHKKLRKDGTMAVDVLYRDPFTGCSRSRTVDAVRDTILDCLNDLAAVVSTKRPEVVRDPKTPFHDVVLGWFADASDSPTFVQSLVVHTRFERRHDKERGMTDGN